MKETYQRKTHNIWFTSQQEPSVTDKALFQRYWALEKERLMHGFYLADGKVFIPGWLYWHTVYWTCELDIKIGGKSYKGLGTPTFRDLDWDMALNKERAEQEQKIIELVGARGFGKSVWDASMAGYYYTLFPNTETCISGAYAADIKVVTDKIETGLTNLHPVFQKQRLKNNWGSEVRAGFKDKKTGNPSALSSNSRIVIRNYQEGHNTMAANGLRPKFHVIDEIGKVPNLINCVMDTLPCWMNETGMFCIPILSGTGGDMEVGKEASDMFFSPLAYNILEFEDTWEHRGKIGWFVPATKARNEYKFDLPLSQYLGIDHPDLHHIIIKVSDEDRCLQAFIEPRRQKALKSGNPAVILKEKAYYPIKPSESFLVLSANPFDVTAAEKQLFRIKHQGLSAGIPVALKLDEKGHVYHTATDKRPITEFPVKDQDPAGCVVVYEFPLKDPPWGLYTAGIDPYKQDQAKYSDSLGAVYIFKRTHNITDEHFQDMFVASYVGRPANKLEWYETTRLLLKWYNATALVENEDVGFIDYMLLTKKEGHYLADQPAWLKEIHPNSTVRRSKGLHVTPKIRAHLNGKLLDYQREPIAVEHDDEGQLVKEVLGTSRILDPMLLEEMIKYNATGNFDRVVAASLAITQARKLDPDIHVSSSEDDIYAAYFQKEKTRRPLFSIAPLPFTRSHRRSKLFY